MRLFSCVLEKEFGIFLKNSECVNIILLLSASRKCKELFFKGSIFQLFFKPMYHFDN